jgi:hypothetical protein
MNVTAHPTAEWTAMQLTQAFPFETAPRFIIRFGEQSVLPGRGLTLRTLRARAALRPGVPAKAIPASECK